MKETNKDAFREWKRMMYKVDQSFVAPEVPQEEWDSIAKARNYGGTILIRELEVDPRIAKFFGYSLVL